MFDSWRDCYAVAGTTQATRSKRRGHRAAQELRAAAALLAEWFRICVRHGYIGQHPRRNRNSAGGAIIELPRPIQEIRRRCPPLLQGEGDW